MKKAVNASLVILSVLMVLTTTVIVRAAQNTDKAIDKTAKEEAEYTLAYPGMLPDHPFYFLKMIRDKVVGWLITDSVKKAEYDVLMSDKRLLAGMLLVDSGKEELAQETISKGEKYMILAIDQVRILKDRGDDVSELAGKIRRATAKHSQELKNLRKRVSKIKKGIDEAISLSEESEEKAEEFLKEN